jgi:predicted nucleotidyltransferase
MAQAPVAVIETVKRYIQSLEDHGIHIDDAILFGSFAKGKAREESDIDVALISKAFSGDRFDDRRRIVPLRRAIDNRIEPIPFRPERFAQGGILVDEIRREGIRIDV